MELEYTSEIKRLLPDVDDYGLDYHTRNRDRRDEFTKKYSWAIPTVEALEVIGKYGPLVEVGAGTGYWAYELRKRGVTIDAYDKYPANGIDWTEEEMEAYGYRHNPRHPNKNWYHRGAESWTEVLQGTPDILKTYSREWNLFLCWPPYKDDMAMYALGYHRGDYICYVGEDHYGCNGDKWFWRLLQRMYEEVETVCIPQWPGIHDYVNIYKRKGR